MRVFHLVSFSFLCVCDREWREITGDKPPDLSGFCGSHVNDALYIFAGCDAAGYTNQASFCGLKQNPPP